MGSISRTSGFTTAKLAWRITRWLALQFQAIGTVFSIKADEDVTTVTRKSSEFTVMNYQLTAYYTIRYIELKH